MDQALPFLFGADKVVRPAFLLCNLNILSGHQVFSTGLFPLLLTTTVAES